MKRILFFIGFIVGITVLFTGCNFDFSHSTEPFELSVWYQLSPHIVSTNCIDDFFDGDDINYLGTTWEVWAGSGGTNQGTADHSIISHDDDFALQFNYTVGQGGSSPNNWQEVDLILPMANSDISSHYSNILKFDIKTSVSHSLFIILESQKTIDTGYNHFNQDILSQITSTNWLTVKVVFTALPFKQDFGTASPFLSVLSNTAKIKLADKTANAEGIILIDNVRWTNQ